MVTRTFPRNRIFSYSINVEGEDRQGDLYVYYYDPNGLDMYKIKLSAASETQFRTRLNEIKTWMNTADSWAGTVVETWHKQNVVKPQTNVEEWVKE